MMIRALDAGKNKVDFISGRAPGNWAHHEDVHAHIGDFRGGCEG